MQRQPRDERVKHRKRGTSVDWGAVREHWVTMNLDPTRDPKRGEYSFKEVATIFHVAVATVRNKSSSDGWRSELTRRQNEIATQSIERAQETSIIVEAEIRRKQIAIADGMYSLLIPIIKRYQGLITPEGTLDVSPKEMKIFLEAMKEGRAAAGLGATIDVTSEEAALTRLEKHKRTGGLLAELLDEIATDQSSGRSERDIPEGS